MIHIDFGNKNPLSELLLEEQYHSELQASAKAVQKKYKEGRLGFLDVDEYNEIDRIQQYVKEKKEVFDNIVVLGIGGSSLGAKAIFQGMKGKYYNEQKRDNRGGYPKLYFLDNVDPIEIKNLSDILDLNKTFFIVISKSGTTIETISQYNFFTSRIKSRGLDIKKHFAIVTGENSEFKKQSLGIGLEVFDIPENIGGRFSVLTNVGLLPLAFIGIDIRKLLRGVANVKKDLLLENITKNKSLLTAAIQYHSYKTYRKNITIFFPYISNASWLGQWYKQLVGESLGKDKQGPTVGCAQGVTDQHSQLQLYCDGPDDKLIVFLEGDNFQVDYKIPDIERLSFFELMNIEKYGTRESLNEKNRVHYTIKIDTLDEQNMGELIVLFEVQVAILGELFGVNAFDQPGVERSKIIVQEKIKQERGKSGNKF